MAAIKQEFVYTALERAEASINYNIHNNITKQYEFQKQTILDDESLTIDKKTETINLLTKVYDRDKILLNKGTKRRCENCSLECLATLFCEHCVRNYLKSNFSNWTSENNDIDNLIQECQMESLHPKCIIEWIPYNNLQDIKYMTKGGCSEIYSANWIDGVYNRWNSKEQKLERIGALKKVILKILEN